MEGIRHIATPKKSGVGKYERRNKSKRCTSRKRKLTAQYTLLSLRWALNMGTPLRESNTKRTRKLKTSKLKQKREKSTRTKTVNLNKKGQNKPKLTKQKAPQTKTKREKNRVTYGRRTRGTVLSKSMVIDRQRA